LLQKQPDDENFFVDNEEEMDLKEEPYKVPISKEYLGKLQYKVRRICHLKKICHTRNRRVRDLNTKAN